MRFIVRHETLYRYSVPVQLAVHQLRLNPRLEGVHLAARQLLLQPAAAVQVERLDPFGNAVTEVEFSGSTLELRIDSRFELVVFAPGPLPTSLPLLPWPTQIYAGLSAFRGGAGREDPAVQQFARELAAQVGYEPIGFLDRLTSTLLERTDQQSRLRGDAQPAAATLASRQGSCRDLTVLFLAACRSLGFAARFTSGYLAPLDRRDLPRELHAWPEVYLPGAGWRGWDPSQGQRVHDAHVPLCAAPTQNATMPVEGGYFFQGPSVTTTLDFDLRISAFPS